MPIFREIPPTAGFPVYARDVLAALNPVSYRGTLENDFKDYLHVEYAQVTYSGTTALYLACESLKSLSARRTVIIPAYTCPLVPLAIKRAGLEVRVCDINRDNFDFSGEELENLCRNNNDILAIVAVHLAGIPQNLGYLKNLADKHRIFLIEDCAQSLGGFYQDKFTGTIGDFGIYSLCRGKGLTIYEGGVVVTNNKDCALKLKEKTAQLIKKDFLSEGLKILELCAYAFFYHPFFAWFIFSLPRSFWAKRGQLLKAAQEDFTLDFPTHAVSGFRKFIGHLAFHRLKQQINLQRAKANFIIEALEAVKGLKIIREPQNCRGTYPYLALIFDDEKKREAVLDMLRKKGLGASFIYSLPIGDYEYLQGIVPKASQANAAYLCARIVTLSTSAFINKKDLEKIVNLLKGYA